MDHLNTVLAFSEAHALDERDGYRLAADVETRLLTAMTRHIALPFIRDDADKQIYFSPWTHYFAHLATARWLHGEPQPRANFSDTIAPPGDTLAFREASRGHNYVSYLDATLQETFAEPEAPLFRCDRQRLKKLETPVARDSLLYSMRFPRSVGYALPWLCLGKIAYLKDRRETFDVPVDIPRRRQLYEALREAFAGHLWGNWLAARAVESLPRSLLEGAEQRAQQFRPPFPRFLWCANAFDIIDDWRLYSLMARAHGARLIGSPHAVNHGLAEHFWPRDFELAAFDAYLSWGWQPNGVSHVQPFYCPIFVGQSRPRPPREAVDAEVLISAAARPKHLLEFPYLPERFEGYLHEQRELACKIAMRLHRPVVVRTRPSDLGWDVQGWFRDAAPLGVSVEFQQGRFLNRLRRCRLHVCDNTSTACIESMWANHPTVIMITGNYFQLWDEAAAECAQLEAVGVLHRDINSAMAHVANIDAAPHLWWCSTPVQRAVDQFLDRQGRSGPESLKAWRRLLMNPDLPWREVPRI